MKKIIAISAGLLLIVGAICGQDKSPKPYKFKSGIIEYKYSGDKTGTAILYFDDYGMKSAMYSDLVVNGKSSTTWVISGKKNNVDHTWIIEENKKGIETENPFMSWLNEVPNGDIESYLEDIYKKMGMVKSGTEMFLGKECTIFKGDEGKVLAWSGILMLQDLKNEGHPSHQEATSVKTNVPVDPKYFVIPKDITFTRKSGS